MGCCNVRRFISIVMLRFLVTLGTWQCLWLHRTVMSFICFVQKGRAGSCWSLRTIFLCNTPSFTYNFVTHNSSHTTCFTSRSSTTSFIFPSFPVPATTFVAHYWKKLTCGVIISGPLVFVLRNLIHVLPPRWRIGLGQSGQGLIQVYGFHDFPKKRPQQLQGGDGGDRRALDNNMLPQQEPGSRFNNGWKLSLFILWDIVSRSHCFPRLDNFWLKKAQFGCVHLAVPLLLLHFLNILAVSIITFLITCMKPNKEQISSTGDLPGVSYWTGRCWGHMFDMNILDLNCTWQHSTAETSAKKDSQLCSVYSTNFFG